MINDPTSTRLVIEQPSALKVTTEIAAQLFTSGSTGKPKVVPLTTEILLLVRAASQNLYLGEDSVVQMMPQFHIGIADLLLAPLSTGGSVLVANEYSTDHLIACARQLKPTWHQGAPAMLSHLRDELTHQQDTTLQASLSSICFSTSDTPNTPAPQGFAPSLKCME